MSAAGLDEDLGTQEGAGAGMSIRDYLLVVQRHRLLILLVTVAVTVAVGLYSSTRTPIYESRSEVLVTSFERTTGGGFSGGGVGTLDTELRLMLSAPVRDRVAAQLGLAPSDPRLLSVQVSQLEETSIVTIVARDQDPVIAASVSNAYATAYLDSRRDRVLSRTVTARRALDEEITLSQQALEDVDARIAEQLAGEDVRVIGLREELEVMEDELELLVAERELVAEDPTSRLAAVQGRIIALDNEIAALQTRIAASDEQLAALVTGLGGGSFTDERLTLQERARQLRAERDALGTREAIAARIPNQSPSLDTPGQAAARANATRELQRWDQLTEDIEALGDRTVVASNLQLERDRQLAQLSTLTRQRAGLVSDPTNLTRTAVAQLEELDLAITELEADIDLREQDIEAVLARPTVDVSSLRLERDVVFSRLSAFIQQRASLIEDASDLTEGGEVLVRGAVPTGPISPQPARDGMLAFLLGLALGIGLAFAIDYSEDAIRDDLDVRRATGRRPLLGRIPEWVIPGPTREGIVTLLDPSSVAAESYRELSANVRFMALSLPSSGLPVEERDELLAAGVLDRPPLGRGIMLASPTANNGKTATAVNLAVASARAGQRTIIVDADLRRPRVAELFGLGRLRGLSDLLAERGEVDDYLVNVGVPNLLVLPAGTLPPNPSDVLANAQLDIVYRKLQERFDLILIDTPAVLAVPDSLEAGRLVDWALLVMQHTVTTRREVVGTIERLEQVGIRVEGGILNAIDTRSDAYYYYYTYYHRLEYGAAVDGIDGAAPRGPRVPVGAAGRSAPRGPVGGGAVAPRDRVLVPAARPRGILQRINPFDRDGGRDGDTSRGVRGGRIGRVRPGADGPGAAMLDGFGRGRRDDDLGPDLRTGGPDDLPPLEDPEGPY